MNKGLFSIGIRVVAVAAVLMSLGVTTLAFASAGLAGKGGDTLLADGFLGLPWGARPSDLAGARHIAGIAPGVSVYSAYLDLSPVLGSVSALTPARLTYKEGDGLIKAHITVAPRDFDTVRRHLARVLGEPAPIVYELWAARVDFDQRFEWLVGRNTRVVLTSRLMSATVEIGRRDMFSPEGRNFEETLAAAQLEKALEYERQNKFVEASSLYQELLNGSDSHLFYTSDAQARLAAYSKRDDATEYLGKERDMTFRGLVNVLAGPSGQLWVRIELGREARAELQGQRPGDSKPQDGEKDFFAALCRVRADYAEGKYVVIEQLWLDGSNRIVGGRPAWTPQDAVWPAPYISQACEGFLKAWFTAGKATASNKKQ